MPLPSSDAARAKDNIFMPTSDGGIEHTIAEFADADEWLRRATRNEIILFPPQFYLLHALAPFLASPRPRAETSLVELQEQRERLLAFIQQKSHGSSNWAEMVICPTLLRMSADGRSVLALDKTGLQPEEPRRRGDPDMVILLDFRPEGPRNIEIMTKQRFFTETRKVEKL